MKAPNGYGGVSKLPGARRRPWRVRITKGWAVDDAGKSKQLYGTLGYYATRKEAMIALADYNDNPYDLDAKKITFGQLFDRWFERDKDSMSKSNYNTSRAFRKHLLPLEDMPMGSIKLMHLQEVLDSISDKSTDTQSKVKMLIGKTFRYAIEHDIVDKDYTPYVKVKKNPHRKQEQERLITQDELKTLLAQPLDETMTCRYAGKLHQITVGDIPTLLLYTGCRISELLSLKVSDIHLDERWMHIPGTKSQNADRIAPIHRAIENILRHRIETTTSEYLFPMKGSHMKSVPFRANYWAPLMERLGMNHTPHDTRHTFISLMDKAGVDAGSVVLKRIVGHSNGSITEHYTHKGIDELIAAIDKFKLI